MPAAPSPFVHVKGPHFIRDGKPYYFLGTNFWYGMNLAVPGGDRERLCRELDSLQALGLNNLRIMAASEGPDTAPWRMTPALQTAPGAYNEDLLKGLDFLLSEMARRKLLAIVCLNNFWPWSGGMAQYLEWAGKGPIPYPPPAEKGSWSGYILYTKGFYSTPKAWMAYETFLRFLLQRSNSITGVPYKEDPTIMAWELANEPRGTLNQRAYRKWVDRSASLIKSLDPNHLVTIGSEGKTDNRLSGTCFVRAHKGASVDYATLHIWVQNWGWYDPLRPEETYLKAEEKALAYLHWHVKKARSLNMPLVLEEFGMARDGDDHSLEAPVHMRDKYYERMFSETYRLAAAGEPLAGANFWAWAGEGRPREPHALWQAGDDFIGDPPHEYQGWYSVYDQDSSTLKILREYGKKMEQIRQ